MSAAERERTSSANQISHKEPGEVVMPARERNVCVFCQNDPMTDHAFFFMPARTASAVIGMCRTRTPTAL